MRKTIELSQDEIVNAVKEMYGIKFSASFEFLIDLHGDPKKISGMPISGTISAISVQNT